MEVTKHEGKKVDLNDELYWIQEYYGIYVPKELHLSVAEK
ncbi:MAG: hypothetical protein A4E53_04552 [Pelotomaculum sp. PtaB.Bin104]|nr:MAG: hypothetical protein A4E53_04552 [Pelotomaculum sp. PtaB.Bin104]